MERRLEPGNKPETNKRIEAGNKPEAEKRTDKKTDKRPDKKTDIKPNKRPESPIDESKAGPENLSTLLRIISKYLDTQVKNKNIRCPFCSDASLPKEPNTIQELFKLYSAYIFCLLKHCKNIKYEKDMVSIFFNLEIFLLVQISMPDQGFFDAYKKMEIPEIITEMIKYGQFYKVDNAIHIYREEEIESLTYKYYRRYTSPSLSDTSSFTDDEITLICLVLYQRNEPHRFFRIFKERKLLINHRIAVMFSIVDDSLYNMEELLSNTLVSSLTYQDILKYELKYLSIAGSPRKMPMSFFEKLRKKFGLNKISKQSREITYEKKLKNFDGIIVTKKTNINTCMFKKWYRKQKHHQKWKECVSLWINNRLTNKNAVDLSMMDICTQYYEFEKGHYIYEKLEADKSIEETRDRFLKYTFLCIKALEEGNRNFNQKISTDKNNELEDILTNNVSLDSNQITSSQIPEEKLQLHAKTLSEIKNAFNYRKKNEKKGTFDRNTSHSQKGFSLIQEDPYSKTNGNQQVSKDEQITSAISHLAIDENVKLSQPTDENVKSSQPTDENVKSSQPTDENVKSQDLSKLSESQFDFKSTTYCILKDASGQGSTSISTGGNSFRNHVRSQKTENKNTTTLNVSSNGSDSLDPVFIELWTVRLVSLIKKIRAFPKKSKEHNEIVYLICKVIFEHILYFERNCRKEILEAILCNVCINDEIVQLILKGFYCYCISSNRSNLKDIADADLIHNFCQRVYQTWKNKQSPLNFFRRKNPIANQDIYCCMLGVCCETKKNNEFLSVCKDFKSSSTDLNGEMIQIFEKYHRSNHCNCNYFQMASYNDKNKKNIIKHLLQNN